MTKRLHILVVMVVLAVGAVGADEGFWTDTPYEKYPSSLGYYVNTSGGVGLSWQHWYGSLGLAFAAGAMYNEEGDYPFADTGYQLAVLDYSIQARLSWLLYAEEFSPWLSSNLHAVAYLAYRGLIGLEAIVPTEEELDDPAYTDHYNKMPYESNFMVGGGVAVEMTAFEHFSQTLDFMYVAKWPLSLDLAVGYSLRYRY
ncbi:MAG: hypothetical protein A2Z96_07885 [Spirochaetes bacterium GWB1_48_6]|nr:MAG: hypothetical protein A2Z96_07885 [Spirochaetes bacterium GWB1_48_6]